MKMYGKLGWYGQCDCCCGKADKSHIRQEEERQWLQDYEDEEYEMRRDDWDQFGDPNVSKRIQS